MGGKRDITDPAPITIFGVDSQKTTNGALSNFYVTWYSEIDIQDGDTYKIPFPAEIQFDNRGSSRQVIDIPCSPMIDSII